jgi:phosphoribosylcarboxyaminoimidazole (NCAIR) mutase
MVTVIWAAAAEVIITDGAEDAVITTAGHAVAIAITVDNRTGGRVLTTPVDPDLAAGFDNLFSRSDGRTYVRGSLPSAPAELEIS